MPRGDLIQGDLIQEGDLPVTIAGDHRIADAGEHHSKPLLLIRERARRGLPLADVARHLGGGDDGARAVTNGREVKETSSSRPSLALGPFRSDGSSLLA